MKMKYTPKVERGQRSAEPRGTPDSGSTASTCVSVDDYIAAFPPETRQALTELRESIRAEAPEAEEKISYGIPTFFFKGNLVHFAAFKNHIGFYPAPSGITAFEKELAPYKQAKGSVQFPLDRPLPLDLVRRITRFRVKESNGNKE
jgi:uncharacterized protein YdhG (YjbR/CyaY superfamily)